MASETGSKLNRLYQLVPEGLLVDAAWLEKHGYSHPLRQKYVAAGWLASLARGVYRRPPARLASSAPSAAVDWELVVLSLQNLMRYGVSVGGRTALELQGFAHYLPARGGREVHLYTSERLPGWLAKIPANATWVVHNDRLFENEGRGLSSLSVNVQGGATLNNDPLHGDSLTTLPWGHWNWPLTVSTPERAALELVDELPTRESFDQVDALMDGLATLSPRRLQRLLEACRSVKAKRLFLLFAERHNHAWFKKLDRSRIDLGRGKRALVAGGRLHPKYLITVPDSLLKSGDGL